MAAVGVGAALRPARPLGNRPHPRHLEELAGELAAETHGLRQRSPRHAGGVNDVMALAQIRQETPAQRRHRQNPKHADQQAADHGQSR